MNTRDEKLAYLSSKLTVDNFAQVKDQPEFILDMLIASEQRAETAESKAKESERAENEEIAKVSHLFDGVQIDGNPKKSGLIRRAFEMVALINLAHTATATTARQTAINTAITAYTVASKALETATAEHDKAIADNDTKATAKAQKAIDKALAEQTGASEARQIAEKMDMTEDTAKATATAQYEKILSRLYWLDGVYREDKTKLSPAQSAKAIIDCLDIVKAQNLDGSKIADPTKLIARLTADRKTLSEKSAELKKAKSDLTKAETAHKKAPTEATAKAVTEAKKALADTETKYKDIPENQEDAKE